MPRSRSLRCVFVLALFCGTAISTSASWAQEATDLQGTLNDVGADNTMPGDEALPPPPPPIFSTAVDEPIVAKAKAKDLNPYAPLGVRAGAFILLPTLEIGTEIHTNACHCQIPKQTDVGLRFKPSLGFASDWSRHSLSGNVTAEWLHYGTDDTLSTMTGSANIDFRLDIRRTMQAEFKADTAITQTGLGTSATPATAVSGRTDHVTDFSASLANDLGGAVVTGTVALARNTYGDVALSGGGVESNADLNYYQPSLSLRGSLGAKGAQLMPFAEVTYAPRTHDQTLDRNGINRNSQGGSLSVGLTLDDGPIWTGEMAVTGNYRNYADPSLGAIAALGLNGNLVWSPTPLDKATLTASLTQAETSTVGLAATNTWAAGLDFSHSLADNIQLLAGAGLTVADTGSGFEKTATVRGGFEYALNRDVATRVTAQKVWYVDGPGTGGYTDESLIASIILRR